MLLVFGNAFSQYNDSCRLKLTQFYELAKNKEFHQAYIPWKWCFDNCPDSNIAIYTTGLKIVEYKYLTDSITDSKKIFYSHLIDSIFTKRIRFFPQDLSKIYDAWATSLEERGAPKDSVFQKLLIAYSINPLNLGAKNTGIFFDEILDKYKISDTEKVNDIYNTLVESINTKILDYTGRLDSLIDKEEKNGILSNLESRKKKSLEISLKTSDATLIILEDQYVSAFNTDCFKLYPLYGKNFRKNKEDFMWLRRAYALLSFYKCTDNSVYKKIENAYIELSSEYEITTSDNLKTISTNPKIQQLLTNSEAEANPYKKAGYLYEIAEFFTTLDPPISAAFAKKALEYQPTMGKAYLLISIAYARSANSCGTDEFSKRMVFVAAADKAKKAKEVDPSVTALADKYIEAFMQNAPSRIHSWPPIKSDTPFKIGCWINETVKIP